MKYSLQTLKNRKIFKRRKYTSQMHWTSNIFGHPATTIRGFWASLNYPILNFKKTVCPKNVWMRHCLHKMMICLGTFFIFFKIFIFQVVSGVKGQKMAQNDKKFCLSHFISQGLYIKWFWFTVHLCRITIFPEDFLIVSKF